MLAERQLVGEEKRLALRGLTAEQVRADLIIAAAHHDGSSRNARLCDLAASLDISQAYTENALSGRVPLGDALLDGLYGPSPANELPDDWEFPSDFGPMLPDAIAAGLVETSGFVAVEPDSAPAPVPTVAGAAADPVAEIFPPDTATDLPVVAETTISAPELGTSPCVGDAATTGTFDLNSLRTPEPASQDGEGTLREGSTIPAGPQGQSPVLLRDAAGEGAPDRASPPPPTNSFTRVLVELDEMEHAAAAEIRDAEADAAAAERRVQLARLTYDALVTARNSVAEAHRRALELINNPPVTLAERRAA